MVAVMYLGQLIEVAPTRELFSAPRHPYTKALLSSIPNLDPDYQSDAQKLEGEIPSSTNPPSGCKFHTRCHYVVEHCKVVEPLLEHPESSHDVACHRWEELMNIKEIPVANLA
jgi:oligopeptide/dipeptide ABC transporter ATP-binding protein